jgi:2-hydroxy-3-keto-5-methylthiopentenyl-1-phosphate phosphatase
MAQSLPAMKTNPKFIFFTDFDGTITLFDSEYLLSTMSDLNPCFMKDLVPSTHYSSFGS